MMTSRIVIKSVCFTSKWRGKPKAETANFPRDQWLLSGLSQPYVWVFDGQTILVINKPVIICALLVSVWKLE